MISEFLKFNADVLHRDDEPWWRRLAGGGEPGSPPRLPTLFRIGRIYDDLGDVKGLQQTIQQMEFQITGEQEQVYLEFLRTLYYAKQKRLIEAWEKLREILQRERMPANIEREFLVDLVEEVQEDMQWLQEARRNHHRAAAELETLYRSRRDLGEEMRVAVEAAFWQVRFTGLLLDRHVGWGSFESLNKQLADVLEGFEELDKFSFFEERVWLSTRDAIIRGFKNLYYLGKSQKETGTLVESLQLLGSLEQLQHDDEHGQLLAIKALVHRELAILKHAELGRDAAREDWRKVGQMLYEAFRKSPDSFKLQKAAAAAFDEAGDTREILRVANPVTFAGVDRELFLMCGKAQARLGDYQGAIHTFDRIIENIRTGDVSAEDINTAALETNHAIVSAELQKMKLFTLDDYVDAVNGIGPGFLLYSARKRSLKWQAPADREPGPELLFDSGDFLTLPSADEARTISLTVLGGEADFPEDDVVWEIYIDRHDTPLDPADVYFWRAISKVYQARLRRFGGREDALGYASYHLGQNVDSEAHSRILSVVSQALRSAYEDPGRREKLAARFRDLVGSQRRTLVSMSGRHVSQHEKTVRRSRLEDLDEILRTVDTVEGAELLLRYRDPRLQSLLCGSYLKLIGIWFDENTSLAIRTFDKFERARLDRDARRDLVFLCENFSNRDRVWKGAMYMRAYQYYREARERRAEKVSEGPEAAGADRQAADLETRARELLTRLVLSFQKDERSFPQWEPRTLYLLGHLWATAKNWEEARKHFDRLADWPLAQNAKGLLEEDREEIRSLITSARLAGADAAYRQKDFSSALRRYEEAETLLGDAPVILWIHYQKGNYYTRLDRRSEALREFRKGEGLLKYSFKTSEELNYWLTGTYRARISGFLGDLVGAENARLVAGGEKRSVDWKAFWLGLYSYKLKGVSEVSS